MEQTTCNVALLANDYFAYMLNNRHVMRDFVGKFQKELSGPRRNVVRVSELCDEFNQFRMAPLKGRIDGLGEEDLDKLDGALLGKLKGFEIETILKHECYEHMRSIEEKPLEIGSDPILIRGLVPM